MIILSFGELFAQKKDHISAEVDANYYPYNTANVQNGFNYGFSFLTSAYIDRLKVSLGINWVRNYDYYNEEPTASNNYFEKRDYQLKYMNIPLLVTIIINPLGKVKVGITNGFILNNLYSYRVTSYYSTKDPVVEKDVQVSDQLLAFYQCEVVARSRRPGEIVIDDRGLTFGLKIGLEYRFFKE